MKLNIIYAPRKDKNFTIISNSLFQDADLTFDAKGFFALLLTLPPNWQFSITGMAKITGKSKQWINKVLNELIKKGLCNRKQVKTAQGRFSSSEYTFIEKHSNNRTTPLAKCGSRPLTTEITAFNSGTPNSENRDSQNRIPENRTTVFERNKRTVVSKDDSESKNSLLSSPSSSNSKQLAFSGCESDGHLVAQNEVCEQDMIEPPWNKILPLEACATAFVGCAELVNVRKQLIANAALRDEAHLLLFAKEFNEHLVMQGVTEKQYEDWKDHFINWLRLQDSNELLGASENFNRREKKVAEKAARLKAHQPYMPYAPRSKPKLS